MENPNREEIEAHEKEASKFEEEHKKIGLSSKNTPDGLVYSNEISTLQDFIADIDPRESIDFILKVMQSNIKAKAVRDKNSIKFTSEMNLLEFLYSLKMNMPEQLIQYFNITFIAEFQIDAFKHDWKITSKQQTNALKAHICEWDLSLSERGFSMKGEKKKVKENEVYIVVFLDSYPIKLSHFFGGKNSPIFVAEVETIPFGIVINDLAKAPGNDPILVPLAGLFKSFELTENKFSFRDFQNFELKSTLTHFICSIAITNGNTFNAHFECVKEFKFENMVCELSFLDDLCLNQLSFTLSTEEKSKGLTIKGFFPLLAHPLWKDLFKALLCSEIFSKVPFEAKICDFSDFTANITILNKIEIREGLSANLNLALTVFPNKPPEYKIEGELVATISEKDLKFRLALILGVSTRISASMIGTWENPFGLQKSHIKDLGIELGYYSCAFMGEIKIGKWQAKLAISYDAKSLNNMLEFELANIEFSDLLEIMDINIPPEIEQLLRSLKIQHMGFKSIPPGGVVICGKKFEEGISAKLKSTIFGFNALINFYYKKNSLVLIGELDPIEFENIFKLTNSQEPTKGPSIDVQVGFSLDSHFKIDGLVNVVNTCEQSVSSVADINGLVFKGERNFKICGMDFISCDFELRVGFLRLLEDGFYIKATFSTYEDALKKLAEEIRKFAENAKKQFENAQIELRKCTENLTKEQEIQRNKHEVMKQKWNEAFENMKREADEIKERDIRVTEQRLRDAEDAANRDMEKAIRDAEGHLEWEKNRAQEELDREKRRAHNEIETRKRELENTMRGEREKLKGIEDSISWHENLSWFDPRRAGLAGLYPVRAAAYAGIAIAEETAKAGLNLGDGIYSGILAAADLTYKGMLVTANATCLASITAAKLAKTAAIFSAEGAYKQSRHDINEIHKGGLEAARAAGDFAQSVYLNAVDLAFETAKTSVKAADLCCEGLKIASEQAGYFLADTANKLAQFFIIKLLSFEFDLKKKMTETKFEFIFMNQTQAICFKINFNEVGNYYKKVADEIWEMILLEKFTS